MVSFLFHLYQPSYQEQETLKRVAEECYLPLFKFLKSSRNFNVSLNMPLSLLSLLEENGYASILDDVKALIVRGQIELVGSAAYHALLPKINKDYRERQIVLNEYALGYYFGRRTGFEGEKSVLIPDIYGFFPPELAISAEALDTIANLGYSWVLLDEISLSNSTKNSLPGVYSSEYKNLNIVVRNRTLSNGIAFKRDAYLETDLANQLLSKDKAIVALDGETFGHHNSQGIELLYNIADLYYKNNVPVVKMSDYVYANSTNEKVEIITSSWGATNETLAQDRPFPLWDGNTNIQVLLWKLLDFVQANVSTSAAALLHDDYSNINLWNSQSVVATVKEENIRSDILLSNLVLKSQNSDQFWWASRQDLPSGDHLYSVDMLRLNLSQIKSLASYIEDEQIRAEILALVQKVENTIE